MTKEDFIKVCHDIVDTKNNLTMSRATATTSELELKGAFQPLVDNGSDIQERILLQLPEDQQEERDFYSEMSDEDKAILSIILNSIDPEDYDYLDEMRTERGLTWDQVYPCLSAALGITAIEELALKGVINAKTLMKAVKAVGKRYLGYIGVAVMVYEFMQCMDSIAG